MSRSASVWLLCLTAVGLLMPIHGIPGEEIDLSIAIYALSDLSRTDFSDDFNDVAEVLD